MLRVCEAESSEAQEVVSRFSELDVYYRPEYLRLAEIAGEGEGRIAFFEGARGAVLYPFLLKEIPDSSGGKKRYDIVSPYGYGGPLYVKNREGLGEEFSEAFHGYCVENGIVTEFIRFFHPILANHEIFVPDSMLEPRGSVVVWELAKPKETLSEELSLKVKRNIKTAERAGVEIFFDEHLEFLEEFMFLYEATMERRAAEERYRFGRGYFDFIRESLNEWSLLTFARWRGRAVAGALFFASGPFMAYHLSGFEFANRGLCANELLLFQAALRGKVMGCRFLNLGGGVGGGKDSLLRFKTSFTPTCRPAFLGKVVHDEEAYRMFLSAWESKTGKIAAAAAGFFPAYRIPKTAML